MSFRFQSMDKLGHTHTHIHPVVPPQFWHGIIVISDLGRWKLIFSSLEWWCWLCFLVKSHEITVSRGQDGWWFSMRIPTWMCVPQNGSREERYDLANPCVCIYYYQCCSCYYCFSYCYYCCSCCDVCYSCNGYCYLVSYGIWDMLPEKSMGYE